MTFVFVERSSQVRATKNTWPYYRYRETAGKLNLVHHNTNLHYAPAIHITTSINVYFAALDVYITHGILNWSLIVL